MSDRDAETESGGEVESRGGVVDERRLWIVGAVALVAVVLALVWWHRSSERDFEAAIVESLQRALTREAAETTEPASADVIGDLYASGQHEPLWFDGDEPGQRASALVAELRGIDADGLDPAAYETARLASEIEGFAGDVDAAAELELTLSRTFLAAARDLRHGRVSPASLAAVDDVGEPWLTSRQPPDDWARILAAVRTEGPAEVLARQRPAHRQYDLLREQLARYRRIVRAGGWPAIPDGPVLSAGDEASPARMRTLAERLAAIGLLDEEAVARTARTYDDELAGALRRFQGSRTLERDGELGGKTLEELNVSAPERLRQIELNLERWHWVPDPAVEESIWVNIPTYRLFVLRGDEIRTTMRVVVGSEATATPVFSDQMEYVVVNPEWNVPESITRAEIVPKLRDDPSYLASRNMVAVPSDGTDGEIERTYSAEEIVAAAEGEGDLPFRVKQLAGPDNALGRIKFMFPNAHSIYLHDTPEQHLMEEPDRSFSHGCIRLDEPFELAEIVLEGTDGWDAARARQAVGGERQTVELDEEIPVHIVYFTAMVGEDGQLFFGEDLYGIDRAHSEALDDRRGDRSKG